MKHRNKHPFISSVFIFVKTAGFALKWTFAHLKSFTSNFEIKSNASLEIFENASSSKSYFPIVTLVIVSTSFEPINGDSPESL